MKTVEWTAYGSPDTLRVRDAVKPAPTADEVLIRIHATTVTLGDCETRELKLPLAFRLPLRMYFGWRRPTRLNVLGQELAGEVETVGAHVTRFSTGDQVMATTGMRLGAYAEYICLPASSGTCAIAIKPSNLTFEEAAAVPTGGLEAVSYLRRAHIQQGHKVLINGAGGSIGTFGVQFAKSLGAEVTAVDCGAKLDMLRSIGADRVIDYTREDFTRSGIKYDTILDVVGAAPFRRTTRTLTDTGYYLIANARVSTMLRALWTSFTSRRKVIVGAPDHAAADLDRLRNLVESGTLIPIIDRRYPLDKVAEAHRYVDTGQKSGHVVITVVENSNR